MVVEKEIIVRKASSKDATGIISVLTSTSLGEEKCRTKTAFVTENLKDLGRVIVLVAEFNSSIIGFVDCIVFPSFWEGQKQGLIADFFVRDKYQAQGVGSKLLEALVKWAEAQNVAELHVSTGWKNAKARKFYDKHGFTEEQLLLERCRGSE
ncbi:MAG TPA: GNAT family N-acetyltransferase [Candidatus Acidoferrales bacterium]|nr:GNAT family N-acetyltransferase [Candidatus Acidoferrales bacterium]